MLTRSEQEDRNRIRLSKHAHQIVLEQRRYMANHCLRIGFVATSSTYVCHLFAEFPAAAEGVSKKWTSMQGLKLCSTQQQSVSAHDILILDEENPSSDSGAGYDCHV